MTLKRRLVLLVAVLTAVLGLAIAFVALLPRFLPPLFGAIGDQTKPAQPQEATHRFCGQLLFDDSPDYFRSGLPRAELQMKVIRYEVLHGSDVPPTEKDCPALSWKTIEEGYGGVYGIKAPLDRWLKKRVQISGVVDGDASGTLLFGPDGKDGLEVELLDTRGKPFVLRAPDAGHRFN